MKFADQSGSRFQVPKKRRDGSIHELRKGDDLPAIAITTVTYRHDFPGVKLLPTKVGSRERTVMTAVSVERAASSFRRATVVMHQSCKSSATDTRN